MTAASEGVAPEDLDAPSLLRLLLARKPGLAEGEALPAIRREARLAHLGDPAALAAITGWPREDLPPTWPAVVAAPLHKQLMGDPAFPLPVAGLVHVDNRIEVAAPLDPAAPALLRVFTGPRRPDPRGVRFELVTEVVPGDGEGPPAWREVKGILSRAGGRRGGRRAPGAEAPAPEEATRRSWELPADLGRRYARVSGDANPIHLHPWTARPFGFRRPIAHGMWTLARALAELADRLPPPPWTATVRFRRPAELPSSPVFAAWEDGAGLRFRLVRAGDGKVLLDGAATRGLPG